MRRTLAVQILDCQRVSLVSYRARAGYARLAPRDSPSRVATASPRRYARRMKVGTAATGVGRSPAVPWYLWCSAMAVTSAYVGGYWDISWHRSIGRDSFWSLPHMAIYACGVLAGMSSAYLIVTTTWGRTTPVRAASSKQALCCCRSINAVMCAPQLSNVQNLPPM